MPYPRGFIRDFIGQPLPFGQVERTIYEPFISGTVPSWITTSAASVATKSLVTGNGGLSLTTAATVGASAVITAPALAMANFEPY
jgi:hypothetical protein